MFENTEVSHDPSPIHDTKDKLVIPVVVEG